MKNVAVIYKSKYGATKQYAEWIAYELDASLLEASKVKASQLKNYDVVVYGGGLYAGSIIGVKLVTNNPCKKLVIFTVGVFEPDVTDYSAVLSKNFTPKLLSEMKVFHLRGGIYYAKLGLIHKGMITMLTSMISKAAKKEGAEISAEDKLFLDFMESYNGKLDFTDKATITPLIDYVHAL